MNFKTLFALFFTLTLFITKASAFETAFYTLRDHADDRVAPWSTSLQDIKKYHHKISMIIPQTYIVRANGDIGGNTDDIIDTIAAQHHVKIMPLVTNTLFDASLAHQFLNDPSAQTKAINTLVANCKTHHFDGLQFDFEMIAISDRDALTAFFKQAAEALHQNGLRISFAVAPITSSHPSSYFQKRLNEHWEGAYDLKAIARFADFISIMAYDQHASGTTPGGTANFDWVNQVVANALASIPANKISLGIPSYSTHWYLGKDNSKQGEHTHINMDALSHADAMTLLKQQHAKLLWDANAKINYAIFTRDWLNEYLFLENEKSFVFKISLVKKYHLRGISFFDLGSEDPRIWEWL